MKTNEKITRVAYIIEAGFEHFIALFVTGTMLGYLLDVIGFSDALQGIISTVATFTCGAQLCAIFFSPQKRKRLVTIGHLINQACFFLLYLLPVFNIPSVIKPIVLTALLFVGHTVNNAINPMKITWLMSSVPNETRGRFTAVKEMISLAGGMAVSLGFGAVADRYRDVNGLPTRPYYVICATAIFIMMAIHTVSLLVSTDKIDSLPARTPAKLAIESIFKNSSLIKVIGVGIIWNIASAISVSFYASYVREELGFSFTVLAIISMIGSVCRILVSPILGKIGDKYSFSTSMTISFFIIAIGFFAMCFTRPETKWIYLVYVCLHAFAMAGINSGVINLIYDYVVPEDRAIAMGIKNALGGILGFFTALLSGFALEKIQVVGGIYLFGASVYAQQILSLASFAATVLLIVYMRAVIAPLNKISKKEGKNNE